MLCVCYNSYTEALNYLSSINSNINADEVDLDLFFIDNSSEVDDIAVNELKSKTYNFNLNYFKSQNLGYFPSTAAAVEKLAIHLNTYDYTIISNVDLSVSDDFFSNLKELNITQSVGAIAPTIYSKALDVDRNPKIHQKPSLLKLIFLKFLFGSSLTHLLLRLINQTRLQLRQYLKSNASTIKKLDVTNNAKIYAGHGSFLILTRKLCAGLGNLDYPVFLFGEEIYVGETCIKFGLEVVYSPELVVYDSEHVSTGLMQPAAYRKFNAEALDYILKTFKF